MEIITLKDFTFTYPQGTAPAVCHLSSTVASGDFITVCGVSGCGKTTLLRNLKPALAPNGVRSGAIYFNGKEVDTLSLREQSEMIGFVQQSPDNQLVTDKVWHELAFGPESLGLKTEDIRGRVAEMAAFFGIEDWFYKNTSDLSGGQKQILNLASVMVMQPAVLILDEPTGQLDPIAAQKFLDVLSRINRELGTTIILSEHRLEEAFAVSNRVWVMENGQILADGSPKTVGLLLKANGHAMQNALPTAMRVYTRVENEQPCPVTVSEGRNWLLNQKEKFGLQPVPLMRAEEPQQTMEPILVAEQLWFRYEKAQPDVLRGTSLQLFPGELLAVTGGNGAGKTTFLSILAGLYSPQRGQVLVEHTPLDDIENLHRGIVGLLPQNPQTLFVKKTVALELADMVADAKPVHGEQEEKRKAIAELCGLTNVMDRHPYDLSGGEQQRLALAKVLLLSPRILLLDEPTKGLDAQFKETFAAILQNLKQEGVAILMVSHDIEFCAQYADRCAMLFDGRMTGIGQTRDFFTGKNFYTTAAGRMARGILPSAVLAEDIILACGGKPRESAPIMTKRGKFMYQQNEIEIKTKKPEKTRAQITPLKIIFGIVFALLFALTVLWHTKNTNMTDMVSVLVQLLEIIFLGGALTCLIPFKKEKGDTLKNKPFKKQKLSKRSLFSLLMILIAIPFTIFVGFYFLEDKRYYFISFLIIIETLLPFFVIFEAKRPQARELIVVSVLCALGVAGRVVFNIIPQFKPIAAIVIIAGVAFGGETGFLVGAVSGFISNFFFTQGAWTPWQMFCFGLLGFLAGLLFQKGLLRRNKLSLSIFGFISVIVIYGGILNPASLLIWQPNPTWEMILSSYVMGVPFDVIHGAATAFFLWFIAEPMLEKLERIKTKFGILE